MSVVAPTLMLVSLLAACDPGWGYRVPGATEVHEDGRRYDLTTPSDVHLRAYANVFTSNLAVELTIDREQVPFGAH
jgi:hypothetical protein